eukprot:3663872-Ditylum_brightwellii.AAC.1
MHMIVVCIDHLPDVKEGFFEWRRLVVGEGQCCGYCFEPLEKHVVVQAEGCTLIDGNWFR